jgi:hypothetical protein
MPRGDAARAKLLAEAKRRERAAGKKVSRIEANGVNVAHSDFDPRKGARALNEMSAAELRSHVNRVNRFVSRDTQFSAGFAGAPLPRNRVERYKQLEAFNNAKAQGNDLGIADVKLPGQSGTVGGRAERLKQKEAAGNQGRIFQMIERPLFSITNAKALETLIAGFEKKTKRDYVSKTIQARLNSGNAILKYSGNEDLIAEVAKLTNEQKRILIDDSTFFNIAMEQFDSPDKSEVSQIRDVAYEEHEGIPKNIHVREALETQLNWVKEIAPRGKRSAAVDRSSAPAARKRGSRKGTSRRGR